MKDSYISAIDAYEWADASTALKSLPVAITTESIPFIIPLLCVTALEILFSAISTAVINL